MPELPEVEVVRAGLAPLIDQRTIAAIEVMHPRPVRRQPGGPAEFVAFGHGQQFTTPRRRGKFLWLPTANGDALVVHLGMSGQFRWNHADDPLVANTRVAFSFTDTEHQLRFVDQRMFGGLTWDVGGADLPSHVAHIAPDPFEPEFDLDATAARIMARRSTIKRSLLDQSVVSGIGNIYADEALWRARTHGDHPTQDLSTKRARAVLRAARDVMAEALEVGGTSFDALYVNVNGESGYFSRSLDAYGREGLPCKRCGTPMVREQFTNRSSTRCPRCQRLRGRACPAANVAP